MHRVKRVLLTTVGLSAVLFIVNLAAKQGGPKSHNFPDTAFDYARLVEPILGVPPKIDLAEGVELTLYVDGEKKIGTLDECDNPSRLGKGCISGSVLQRYEGRAADGTPLQDVVWVSFGRNVSFEYKGKTYVAGSVQMIGYHKGTGATAFFESNDKIDSWARLDPDSRRLLGKMPWIDDPEAFSEAFRTPRAVQCVQCHQNDPFIHNDFIDAAVLPGTERPVVPRLKDRDRDVASGLPYYVIGGEEWDMRTIHIEDNECLECHRIGMGTASLFMDYGWDPNEHMPPRDPGSLAADWEELQNCWENTPEKTPGCDWVIPPAGDTAGRIVGEDYPHKQKFNTPGNEAPFANFFAKGKKK